MVVTEAAISTLAPIMTMNSNNPKKEKPYEYYK